VGRFADATPILEMSDLSGKGKAKTSYAEVVPSPKPAQELGTRAYNPSFSTTIYSAIWQVSFRPKPARVAKTG
jgi:hypothetical protein